MGRQNVEGPAHPEHVGPGSISSQEAFCVRRVCVEANKQQQLIVFVSKL